MNCRKMRRENYSLSNRQMKRRKLTPFGLESRRQEAGMSLLDLNLMHELWVSYIRELVGDMAGDAQLQARYFAEETLYFCRIYRPLIS